MTIDSEKGSAEKSIGSHLVKATVGSIGSLIRRAATSLDRLVGGPIEHLGILVPKWRAQEAERRHLHSLNDHMLRDIGMCRREVEREVRTGRFGR